MQGRSHNLNTNLTNKKSVLFARACSEYLSAISHLSKVLQYDDIIIDSVVRILKATIEGLQELEKDISSKIEELSREVGEDLTYKRETLLLPRELSRPLVVSGVTTLLGQLIMRTITALSSRLSFASHPVLSAGSVSHQQCGHQTQAALARYGYTVNRSRWQL